MTISLQPPIPDHCCSICGSAFHLRPEHDVSRIKVAFEVIDTNLDVSVWLCHCGHMRANPYEWQPLNSSEAIDFCGCGSCGDIVVLPHIVRRLLEKRDLAALP